MKSEIITKALRGQQLDALGEKRKQFAILLAIPSALFWIILVCAGLHVFLAGLITCVLVAVIGIGMDKKRPYVGDYIFYRAVASMICAAILIICMVRYL